MQRIKRGDTVEVIGGKDKGMRGDVLRVLPKPNRLNGKVEPFKPL